MISQTQIQTAQAARIAQRLVNHWKHKFEIQVSDDSQNILMPTARVSLRPSVEYLYVHIDSQLDDLPQLEQVVLDHLNRMAQQEFNVNWQRYN